METISTKNYKHKSNNTPHGSESKELPRHYKGRYKFLWLITTVYHVHTYTEQDQDKPEKAGHNF